MTATPKETKDVSNIEYFGDPLYTYSLKQGICDGFLAPYKVLRIGLDKDLDGWRPEKGKTDKYGQEIEDREYNERDFDRNLILEQRTAVVAAKITEFLKATDRYAKTIVFCENVDHAERMRQALVNTNPDLAAANSKYVMRITGDNEEGKAQLDNFIDPESPYPVIATTSQLMSTGVAEKGQIITKPEDVLKEPYVLEFLGLDEKAGYSESDLESAIISQLERFLLELGKGFLFESRQRRFFEKFDQFADAPNAVAKMRELVLELAVQRRLVPQNAKEESAHALLERVAVTAKTRGPSRGAAEDAAAPFIIPETWAWVRLPRVLKKLTDGTHHSPPNGPSGAFMYVTAKNIKPDGVLRKGITYVSKEVHNEIYSRCDPSFGDVLYIKDGATTGIATINQLKEPFSMLSSVALLKPSEAIFNRYLLWAMRSPFFYAETRGAMKGAAITRVTLSVMADSLLPLPPLDEQRRIVVKLDQLMALIDQLEAQSAAAHATVANLLSAVVAELTSFERPA